MLKSLIFQQAHLQNGRITPGLAHLYVDKDSPLQNQHHAIWRIKALHDLKTNQPEDFHYTLCFSASKSDWPVIREKLVAALDDCLGIIRPSREEKLGMINIDFQQV